MQETAGPCRKCQYRTGCGDIATHRRKCEPAGLPRISVQTLYALDIKIKDTLLNISVKAEVTKLICPQGYHQIKIYLLSGFMGNISKPLDLCGLGQTMTYLLVSVSHWCVINRRTEPMLVTLNPSACLMVDPQ